MSLEHIPPLPDPDSSGRVKAELLFATSVLATVNDLVDSLGGDADYAAHQVALLESIEDTALAEETARIAADSSLLAAAEAEAAARIAADSAESASRIAADAAEVVARDAAVGVESTARTAAIGVETTARIADVDAEEAARIAAVAAEVTARNTAIGVETANRVAAVAAEAVARDLAIANATQHSITRSIASIATNTAAGATPSTDYVYLVSGATILTLPTAVGNTNRYTVTNVGVGLVTVASSVGQTINGSAQATLPISQMSLDFISDGTNWIVE